MSRRDKQHQRLDALEAELQERLVVRLRAATHGGPEGVFCIGRVIPESYPFHMRDADADALADIADDVLALRDQLGDGEGGVAKAYLDACAYRFDSSDAHRPGPAALATRLLESIQKHAG